MIFCAAPPSLFRSTSPSGSSRPSATASSRSTRFISPRGRLCWSRILSIRSSTRGWASGRTLRVLVSDGPVLLAWVGVYSPEARPFHPAQKSLLQALVPALHARLRTERLLGDQRLTLAAFAPLLEAIGAPALLVDAQAHVHHANRAGVAWLDDDFSAARVALKEALRCHPTELEVTALSAIGMAPRWLVVVRRHRQLTGARVQRAAAQWGLTPRQRQVLARLVEGHANKTIAARLGVAENTVEVHVSAILRKALVDSRAELIASLLGG